jgi:hypothetical protein
MEMLPPSSASTLNMEAVCSSGKLVTTCKTTRCDNPEHHNLNFHRCESLKSHIFKFYFSPSLFQVSNKPTLSSFIKLYLLRSQEFREDGGSMFLRNVGVYLQDHTALQPRRLIRHLHRRENLRSHIPQCVDFRVTKIKIEKFNV